MTLKNTEQETAKLIERKNF